MTPSNGESTGKMPEVKLPLRDWILMPVIGVLTMLVIAGSTETVASRIFTRYDLPGKCMVYDDPSTGARAIPNSVCGGKILEGELAEYRFNSCGHRAGMECGPKPKGTYRIVMIGTSFAMGNTVAREKTFAALLPLELARRTGRKVELYNEAIPYRQPDTWALHFNEVLKAEPDMILWALNSKDIESQSEAAMPLPAPANEEKLSPREKIWRDFRQAFAQKSIAASLSEMFSHSRTATWLCQFLYGSESQYEKLTLIDTDDAMGYLKVEPSLLWQKRIDGFDAADASLEKQAHDAGVPVVAVLLPNHAQAAMIAVGEWPSGFDPYKLDNELRSIITSHGGAYIGIMQDLHTVPSPQLGYFAVEGHPNTRGNAMLTDLLARELTNGAVPALKFEPMPQAALEQGK